MPTADPQPEEQPPVRRRRGSRRVDAPGTGPASSDGPEPELDLTGTLPGSPAGDAPGQRAAASERDRWLLEQRPPHWD